MKYYFVENLYKFKLCLKHTQKDLIQIIILSEILRTIL